MLGEKRGRSGKRSGRGGGRAAGEPGSGRGTAKKRFSERTEDEKYGGLRSFNIVAGVIHLVQGCLMLFLTNDFTVPITRAYLDFNETTRSLEPASVEIYDLWLGPLIASFLLMSALAHLLIGTVLKERYADDLRRGMNRYRWYEYSVSASVMIVAISLLVGIYDIGALLLIFFMNAMMIAWGWMMEVHNQYTESTDWSPFLLGCVAGAIPWVVIAIHLWGAGGGDGGPPDFVYWIFVSIGVAFNCFAINQVLQYKKVGKWKDYLYGERVYIILSLAAKSILAWQVFAGTLQPD